MRSYYVKIQFKMYFACILYNLDCTLSYTKISKTRFEYNKKPPFKGGIMYLLNAYKTVLTAFSKLSV